MLQCLRNNVEKRKSATVNCADATTAGLAIHHHQQHLKNIFVLCLVESTDVEFMDIEGQL